MTEDGPYCKMKDTTVVVMSYIAQIAAYAVCGIIIFHPPDMTNATVATLVGTVVGFLISEAKVFSSYWTGSSRSSTDKDRTIANQQASLSGTGNGASTTTTTTPDGTTVKTGPAVKPTEGPIEVVNAPGEALETKPAAEVK